MNSGFFKKYLLPGFVFQSIVIGGGYGTGRELVEFFMTTGRSRDCLECSFRWRFGASFWRLVLN